MVVVSVVVSTIEPSFKNEGESLFAAGAGVPQYDETNARPVRSIESLPFEVAALPTDLTDVFPTAGWIDLVNENSHLVLGEIKLPKDRQFRSADSNHTRALLVEFKVGSKVMASRQITIDDLMGSWVRRGNLTLNRVILGKGFPIDILFHESSIKVQDDIDMSQAKATISNVSTPGMWSSHKEKGSMPPPHRLMDADTIAFAIHEAAIPQLVKMVIDPRD